ncbi:class D beta-lactamase [Aquabacter spiritensis]|uniref:Beta-lactamase n=1 Tax=Aquabacter spiritensis TaxID=933073 RepID=A0A4R3M1R2_9HYPH|nr:class D beta-lactamase [Aquabacter spiritensis]TCT05097.1 beta-lactamase class D [Aquabacter spiritensis]
MTLRRLWIAGAALAALGCAGLGPARAAEECFLVTELKTARVIAKQGLCASRHSPASTFKIPLALMGYDSGILKSATEPVFTTEPGLDTAGGALGALWAGPQTPQSWMKNSVVWYSQVLTRKLGMERFAGYVKSFAYGNENLSGEPGQDNGLTQAWLSSSLALSPREQVDFLRRMLTGGLKVQPEAVDRTADLLRLPEQPGGFDLYGKTGTGFLRLADAKLDRTRPFGWFVGWVEKDKDVFVFARFMSLDVASDEPLGPRARRQAIAALDAVLRAQAR